MSGPRIVRLSKGVRSFEVELDDGREFVVPYFGASDKLTRATTAERKNCYIRDDGIHWPDIDEDLSVGGLVRDWCKT